MATSFSFYLTSSSKRSWDSVCLARHFVAPSKIRVLSAKKKWGWKVGKWLGTHASSITCIFSIREATPNSHPGTPSTLKSWLCWWGSLFHHSLIHVTNIYWVPAAICQALLWFSGCIRDQKKKRQNKKTTISAITLTESQVMCIHILVAQEQAKCVKSPFGKGDDGKSAEVTFPELIITLAGQDCNSLESSSEWNLENQWWESLLTA